MPVICYGDFFASILDPSVLRFWDDGVVPYYLLSSGLRGMWGGLQEILLLHCPLALPVSVP